jgi:hypothetical protein
VQIVFKCKKKCGTHHDEEERLRGYLEVFFTEFATQYSQGSRFIPERLKKRHFIQTFRDMNIMSKEELKEIEEKRKLNEEEMQAENELEQNIKREAEKTLKMIDSTQGDDDALSLGLLEQGEEVTKLVGE